MLICRKVLVRTTEAVAAELGVCGFYLKLFENKLLCKFGPPSIRPIRARIYNINIPNKMFKIQRISLLIKNFIFFANRNTSKNTPLLYKTPKGAYCNRRRSFSIKSG